MKNEHAVALGKNGAKKRWKGKKGTKYAKDNALKGWITRRMRAVEKSA